MGKKMEQFSLESQSDFHEWKDAIERVLGIGGVEELLSEDEEGMEGAVPDIEGTCVCQWVCLCVRACPGVCVCRDVYACECVCMHTMCVYVLEQVCVHM